MSNLHKTAKRIGMTDVRGVNAGINAGHHIRGKLNIKGVVRMVGLKLATLEADGKSGAAQEVAAYRAADALACAFPLDGANVPFARMESGAALIRWVEGAMSIWDAGAKGAARNLSFARSFGRMCAFWAITGACDRHSGNFVVVMDDKGVGGQLWSIDHETTPRPYAPLGNIEGHLCSFKDWKGDTNMPMANGRAHVVGKYPMARFVKHAASEVRLIIANLKRPEGVRAIEAVRALGKLSTTWESNLEETATTIERFK